jgi:hypothetical protein
MEKPYYSLLPLEARIQLLTEVDFETLQELCQDPLFNKLCHGQRLWELKLEKHFGIVNNVNAKEQYLNLLKEKLNSNLFEFNNNLVKLNENLTGNPIMDEELNDDITKLEEERSESEIQLDEIDYQLSDDWMILANDIDRKQIDKDFKPFNGKRKNIEERRGDKQFVTISFPNRELKEDAYKSLEDKYLFL